MNQPIHVLLVDDRESNLLTLQAVLGSPRYTFVKAKSGAEALQQLQTADFALILMDVQMPEMDGYETARRIKQNPRWQHVPIIFITAMNKDPVHVFRGYDSGAIDYLMKPFDDYVLRSKVAVIADLYERNLKIQEQRRALELLNMDLQREIRERQYAEAALRVAHRELEQRVRERTAALAASNDALHMEVIERKRAEERLQGSLKEKEVLLKEIHHRVKNNLQIILSLLNLQADEIHDPLALEKFKDSQARVRSMALVHEKLYQSQDLGRVDLRGYIEGLASTLIESYDLHNSVCFSLSVEEGIVGIDIAIPCGLILNELVSNALKHAFPGNRQGEIIVTMSAEPGEAGRRFYTLVVKDNGVGLPKGFDIRRSESLGLCVVNALTEQLGGRMEVGREGGTCFTLTFRDLVPAARSVKIDLYEPASTD